MLKLNLQGRTLLITRPEPEAEATARQVSACHGLPLLAPAMTIEPPADPCPLQRALQRASRQPFPYRAILITSINAARAVRHLLPAEATLPPFFAVGKQSAALLQQAGWQVIVPAQAAGGATLAETICQWAAEHPDPCRSFLFPQAAIGRDELISGLSQAGEAVERVEAYRAEPVTTLPAAVQQALAEEKVDAILLFSSRSAQAFLAALPEGSEHWLRRPLLVAISPLTAQSVQEAGWPVQIVAREATTESMLAGLQSYWQQKENG